MKVKLGDKITTTHGDPEGFGHDHEFTVVGILAFSGTPNDRAAFINMEGFYLMKGHAKPLSAELRERVEAERPDWAASATPTDFDPNDQLSLRPLPVEQREVTAILVRTSSNLVAPLLQNAINEGLQAQVVLPILEIFTLFEVFVKPVQIVLLVLTAMICVVSGVSILVSIYNSMAGRRHEIAVMRALGASRGTVLSIILIESIMLSIGGGAVGWVMGHALNWLASPIVERRTGVSVGFFDFAPSVNLYGLLGGAGDVPWLAVSSEILLIPFLLVLAVLVGFLPALSAYRTDVAASLGKSRSPSPCGGSLHSFQETLATATPVHGLARHVSWSRSHTTKDTKSIKKSEYKSLDTIFVLFVSFVVTHCRYKGLHVANRVISRLGGSQPARAGGDRVGGDQAGRDQAVRGLSRGGVRDACRAFRGSG